MTTSRFDIVVIGAGIHGTGIAQAATAAGYSVRVLEQYPQLARGTSSRSSKLIHGGLRYLETGQFHLVMECLRERQILLHNAPQLVRLRPFFIPVYDWSKHQPWILRTGLSLYALLGGLGPQMRFKTLDHRQWQHLEGLRTKNLRVVFQYYDAQTDDRALTHAVMHSATRMGAELILGATVTRIELGDTGGIVQFSQAGQISECHAKVIVNAAGPWANDVLQRVSPRQSPYPYDLVQGTHIIVPGRLHTGIYYVEAPQDGRAVFIMPWGENTLVGTTERIYTGAPDAIKPSNTEIEYLLEVVRHYFPQKTYERNNIIHVFAGARVLPKGRNAASARLREISLITDRELRPRLISIIGGKLTAYRATAQKVMNKIASSLPPRTPIANTKYIPLVPVEHCSKVQQPAIQREIPYANN
ncbi:MAG: glycerol-3-phosphate dehydrogenase/oxidase [Pseudomonadota bacterium]